MSLMSRDVFRLGLFLLGVVSISIGVWVTPAAQRLFQADSPVICLRGGTQSPSPSPTSSVVQLATGVKPETDAKPTGEPAQELEAVSLAVLPLLPLQEWDIKRCDANLQSAFFPAHQSGMQRVLVDVIKVIEELGLTYWLVEGTLLGAWRHHDFIPWDDDIDIMLPLHDRDILVKNVHMLQKYGVTIKMHSEKSIRAMPLKGKVVRNGFRWPFVDLWSAVAHNSTHVAFRTTRDERYMQWDDVFPLAPAQMGTEWMWVPHRPERILHTRYGPTIADNCLANGKLHSELVRTREKRVVLCKVLSDCYPLWNIKPKKVDEKCYDACSEDSCAVRYCFPSTKSSPPMNGTDLPARMELFAKRV